MPVILISEQVLLNLLKDVRRAQGKLYNAHCSRQLITELDWDIRAIEQTTYENRSQLMAEFCKQESLMLDKAPWED